MVLKLVANESKFESMKQEIIMMIWDFVKDEILAMHWTQRKCGMEIVMTILLPDMRQESRQKTEQMSTSMEQPHTRRTVQTMLIETRSVGEEVRKIEDTQAKTAKPGEGNLRIYVQNVNRVKVMKGTGE